MPETVAPKYLSPSLDSLDIAVIGAGPHALTLAAHLLQKRKSWGNRLVFFDPSGVWLSQWRQQFAALEIPHLRSPAVHHPAPNPFALRDFAQTHAQELYPPYDLPGTKLFIDFCDRLIQEHQLQDHLVKAQVERIVPLEKGFQLWLGDGSLVSARRVVVAHGGGRKFLPDWVQGISTPYPRDRLQHSSEVDLRTLDCRGEKILIVGSGLTSGHLAIGAAKRGAKVTIMARRVFYEKFFDADPGWLGPKYLKDFQQESCWLTRSQTVINARNGGSLTPAVFTHLHRLRAEGKVEFIENCEIKQAHWVSGAGDQEPHLGELADSWESNLQTGWQLGCSNGEKLACDRLWLATGSTLKIQEQPLLAPLLVTNPLEVVNGLPVLTTHLRWGNCELYLMGGLAALQIGPTARNLSGARMASDRIVDALIKPRAFQPLIAA
jgi:hypothetical protein